MDKICTEEQSNSVHEVRFGIENLKVKGLSLTFNFNSNSKSITKFNGIEKLRKNKIISLQTKLSALKSILTTVLYGCET